METACGRKSRPGRAAERSASWPDTRGTTTGGRADRASFPQSRDRTWPVPSRTRCSLCLLLLYGKRERETVADFPRSKLRWKVAWSVIRSNRQGTVKDDGGGFWRVVGVSFPNQVMSFRALRFPLVFSGVTRRFWRAIQNLNSVFLRYSSFLLFLSFLCLLSKAERCCFHKSQRSAHHPSNNLSLYRPSSPPQHFTTTATIHHG